MQNLVRYRVGDQSGNHKANLEVKSFDWVTGGKIRNRTPLLKGLNKTHFDRNTDLGSSERYPIYVKVS